MSTHTLTYPITPQTYTRLLREWQQLKDQAKEKGIFIRADGQFNGKATGRVTVTADRVTVEITDHPWLVPIAAIDRSLKKLFA